MENWIGIFSLVVFAMVFNLIVAFIVMRIFGSMVGVSGAVHTYKETLISLLTIIPVAGVAGAPFVIMPFIGPLFAFFVSCCVAPMMLAPRLQISQGDAAKVILPTVAVLYGTTAAILYFGLPMVL